MHFLFIPSKTTKFNFTFFSIFFVDNSIKSQFKRKKSTDSSTSELYVSTIDSVSSLKDKSSSNNQDFGEDSSEDSSQDARRKKKARTTFTGRQIFELEKQFEVKKYLSSSERGEMAKLLNVTETQVSQ